MPVCSGARSKAATQVLFLASEANGAPLPPPSSPSSCSLPSLSSLSYCHFSHLSKSLTLYRVCVSFAYDHTQLVLCATCRCKCCSTKNCSKLCTALFHFSALIITVNVWTNAKLHFHFSLLLLYPTECVSHRHLRYIKTWPWLRWLYVL